MSTTRILQSALVGGFNWTVERYHHAIETGVLTEEDKVELLLGDLIDVLPIGEDQANTVERLGEYFFEKFGTRYRLRSENPVTLANHSEPEPDFVIAKKPAESGKRRHPQPAEILLLIEVSQRTIEKDREVKAPIYASAGIPEYWIINLNSRTVEVHTNPSVEAVYRSVVHYPEGETFESPFVGTTRVSDLF